MTLFFTNSEVRKLLNDFSLIGRDLLAKGAVKAAQTVGPSAEEMRTVDQTAPKDQFITEGGRPAGPGEKPILEQQIPGTGRTFRQDPDHEARIRHPGGQEQSLGSAYNEAYEQKEHLKTSAFQQAGQFAHQAPYEAEAHAHDVLDSDDPEDAATEKKQGIKGKYQQFKVRLWLYDIHLTHHRLSNQSRTPSLSSTATGPTTSSSKAAGSFRKNISLKNAETSSSSAERRSATWLCFVLNLNPFSGYHGVSEARRLPRLHALASRHAEAVCQALAIYC